MLRAALLSILLCALILAAPVANAATFVVTSTSDGGAGSLASEMTAIRTKQYRQHTARTRDFHSRQAGQ